MPMKSGSDFGFVVGWGRFAAVLLLVLVCDEADRIVVGRCFAGLAVCAYARICVHAFG